MTTATRARPAPGRLQHDIEEAYRHKGWVGTSLRQAVRGVDHRLAVWRPPLLRHGIAEIVLHCAYWKNRVRHRILGDRGRTFPLAGRDWFEVDPDLDAAGWAGILEVSDAEHARLVQAVRSAKLDGLSLSERARRNRQQAFGIAMHDMYHTGQIRWIRVMHQRQK